MLNKLYPLLIFIHITFIQSFYSQGIGINECNPDASAIFEIESTTQGVLLPRMTSAQMAAIPSPAKGLIAFNIDDSTLYVFDGGNWDHFKTANTQLSINITVNSALATWSAMPAAGTEFLGLSIHRFKVDLTSADSVRLMVNVSTGSIGTANLGAEYSTDDGTSWSAIAGATGPAAPIATAGLSDSDWTEVNTLAKTDVLVRIIGFGGNGVSSPAVGLIALQFK